MVCVSSRKKEKIAFSLSLFLIRYAECALNRNNSLFLFRHYTEMEKSPLKERKLLLLSLRDALDGWIDGGKVSDISYRYS